MVEAFNSSFQAELVRDRGPWNGINDLELAVAEYAGWYNHRRLHGELGLILPWGTRPYTQPRTAPGSPPEREDSASIKPGT